MNILLLNKSKVYPPTSGGETRTWKTAEKLSELGDLWLACPGTRDVVFPVDLTPIHVDTTLLSKPIREQLWYASFLLSTEHPLQRVLTSRIVAAVKRHNVAFDVVISEAPQTITAAERIAKRYDAKLILDKHNAYYNFLEQQLQNYPCAIRTRAVENLRTYEQEAINTSWTTIFVSHEDEHQFTIPESTCRAIVPNGTEMVEFRSVRDPVAMRDRLDLGSDFTCLFVGAYDYNPNRRAARTIIDNIAPALPDIEFLLVGRNPPENDAPNVHTPGYVNELADVLQLADVALCPLQSGSGTKLKMLDYLAAGLPIVTTPIGAEGIPIADRQTALIRETPAEFVDAIRELERSKSLRTQLTTNAMILGEEFSWGLVLETYESILKEVTT